MEKSMKSNNHNTTNRNLGVLHKIDHSEMWYVPEGTEAQDHDLCQPAIWVEISSFAFTVISAAAVRRAGGLADCASGAKNRDAAILGRRLAGFVGQSYM